MDKKVVSKEALRNINKSLIKENAELKEKLNKLEKESELHSDTNTYKKNKELQILIDTETEQLQRLHEMIIECEKERKKYKENIQVVTQHLIKNIS